MKPKGLLAVGALLAIALQLGACSLASLDGYANGKTGGTGGSASTGSTSSSSGTSSSSTSSSSATGTGGGDCAAGSTCVVPPQGWQGPIALVLDATSAQCTEVGWKNPVPEVNGMSDLVLPTGCGACSCGNAVATCPTSASLGGYGGISCGTLSQTNTVTTGCNFVSFANSYRGNPTTAQVSCTGGTPMPSSQPRLANHAVGCSATSPTACQGMGTCVDKGQASVCIYAEGSSSCPPAFPQQTIVYGGLTSSYACTQCVCQGSVSTCEPTVGLYYGVCGGTPTTLILDGKACSTGVPDGTDYATILDAGTPTPATCSPTGGGTLTGAAAGTSPVTVCCM